MFKFSRELGDPETVFKCHLDLGSLHLKVYHPSEAIVCFKEALSILKKKANVQQMADTLREMAKVRGGGGGDIGEGRRRVGT